MQTNNLGQWITQSQLGRVALIGLLLLILQIPIAYIQDLVDERRLNEATAVAEVEQKWGSRQNIIGPLLIVPFQVKQTWTDQRGVKQMEMQTERAVFLPEELNASNHLVNETRYRGLFKVPLYQADITITGHFKSPDFKDWDISDENILWDKARLVVMVSDARAIQKQAKLQLNNQEYLFEPGTDKATLNQEGYHVDLTDFNPQTDHYPFSIKLKLNGSKSLYIAPLGKDSHITMQAPWADPSFQGKWLPTERTVDDSGFTSQWRIPYLGRNFPQNIRNFELNADNVFASLVGVDLISPVDNYRMSERSIKYELLFLILTFAAIWLIELLANLRVHIIQYLFIGVGLCIFYLLELSLSEHIGFYWAYSIATVAIVTVVSAYSFVILHTGKRATIIGASLSALYLYLFTLLQEQDYALLVGSIGLFVMLALVMYITRNIDWFKIAAPQLKHDYFARQEE